MTEYLTCEWCGCEAWWPRNRLLLNCDCGRTVVSKTSPLHALTPDGIRLADKLAANSSEQNATVVARIKSWV